MLLVTTAIVAGLASARLLGRSTGRLWGVWAGALGAWSAVHAAASGSFVGRAWWLIFVVAYALELRRIVRAWRLIPARDSVTR